MTQNLTFELRSDYIELFKLLKFLNLTASGGEAKQLIQDGLVRVDGKVETRKACKIKSGQIVELMDARIQMIKA